MVDDVWKHADGYERYVGRWSRLVAREFLDWLDRPAGLRWLDVGCGTGALIAEVLAGHAPAAVVGVDPSAGFLAGALARTGVARTGVHGGGDAPAGFAVADARALPLGRGGVDVAVSGLALNFVPDPTRAGAELARVVRPGGLVAAYVWDYAGGMAMMRHFWDAAAALDPGAADEGPRFPLCHPDPLRTLWTECGLVDVMTRPIDISMVFTDFDDFWTPFLGGQGPAPAYAMALTGPARDRLRERLRAQLPTAADGTIVLSARAWAIRGRVAG